MNTRTLTCWAVTALAVATGGAFADDKSADTLAARDAATPPRIAAHANQEHPAVVQSRLARQGTIDPNTFILGHPASPRWIVGHANHDHPAVIQARMAHPGAIDPNTFIVQPPASVRWLPAADAPAQVAVAGR